MTEKPSRGEVVSISDGYVILDKRGMNGDAVALAEWLMKAALAGEIVGIAVAYSFADGSGGWQTGGGVSNAPVLGSLTKMTARLAND